MSCLFSPSLKEDIRAQQHPVIYPNLFLLTWFYKYCEKILYSRCFLRTLQIGKQNVIGMLMVAELICIDMIDMLDSKFSIWFSIYHHFSNTMIWYMCGYLFIFGPHAGVISVQNYGHLIFSFLNWNVKKTKIKQTGERISWASPVIGS